MEPDKSKIEQFCGIEIPYFLAQEFLKGSDSMSNQDIAKSMIDQLPDDKVIFIINILENIGEISGFDVRPKYTPNTGTLEAFAELESGGGHIFKGSTSDLFNELLED